MKTDTPTEATTALVYVAPGQFGLAEDEASALAQKFIPILTEMTSMEAEVNEVLDLFANEEPTKELCERARRFRLRYVKTRSATATIHKAEKAYYLAGGRFVDAWKTAQGRVAEDRETSLFEVEDYFNRMEQERIKVLTSERDALLKPFDAYYPNTGTLDEETFLNLLAGAKARYEQKVAAEKAAEAERIENARREAEQREAARLEAARLAEENRVLREEASRRAAEMEAERKAAEAARRKAEAEADAARLKVVAAERAAKAEVERLSAELRKNHEIMSAKTQVEAPPVFGEPTVSPERAAGHKEVIMFLGEYGFAEAARIARIHFMG